MGVSFDLSRQYFNNNQNNLMGIIISKKKLNITFIKNIFKQKVIKNEKTKSLSN